MVLPSFLYFGIESRLKIHNVLPEEGFYNVFSASFWNRILECLDTLYPIVRRCICTSIHEQWNSGKKDGRGTQRKRSKKVHQNCTCHNPCDNYALYPDLQHIFATTVGNLVVLCWPVNLSIWSIHGPYGQHLIFFCPVRRTDVKRCLQNIKAPTIFRVFPGICRYRNRLRLLGFFVMCTGLDRIMAVRNRGGRTSSAWKIWWCLPQVYESNSKVDWNSEEELDLRTHRYSNTIFRFSNFEMQTYLDLVPLSWQYCWFESFGLRWNREVVAYQQDNRKFVS